MSWEKLTAWHGDPPSYKSTWGLLTNVRLPEAFVDFVRSLNHHLLRKLRLEAVVDSQPSGQTVMEPRTWNNRFANLVSGRFTENLFYEAYAKVLERSGVSLTETTAEHDWLDYLITNPKEGFSLGINVKNAGVQFRASADRVGLSPEDTLPIATYKIFGSTAREGHTPLIYVYLVDWELLPRLRRAFWVALNDDERAVFQLMTSFKGIPRKLEDRFIECTVSERLGALYNGVGYSNSTLTELPFRAISGRRCQRIFYTEHGRAPYVYAQRMNTDPNVHVSVSTETVHFTEFISRWVGSSTSRTRLLEGLNRVEPFPIPDPPI